MFLSSIFLFAAGASFGSFICMAGYREKRRINLWIPFSQCDYCGTKIDSVQEWEAEGAICLNHQIRN